MNRLGARIERVQRFRGLTRGGFFADVKSDGQINAAHSGEWSGSGSVAVKALASHCGALQFKQIVLLRRAVE